MPSSTRFRHRIHRGSDDFRVPGGIWVKNDSLAVQWYKKAMWVGSKDETIR